MEPGPLRHSIERNAQWLIPAAVLGLCALCTPAFAQSDPGARASLSGWLQNTAAERSLATESGELLGLGGARFSLATQLWLVPTQSSTFDLWLGHVQAAFAPWRRVELEAQLPVVLGGTPDALQKGPGFLWAGGRVGLLGPEFGDADWLSFGLDAGLPFPAANALSTVPLGPAVVARVSVGAPLGRGTWGGELGGQVGAGGVDLLAGVMLASEGLHLRGELTLRGTMAVDSASGLLELLGGIRYRLRPIELFLLFGPEYTAGPAFTAAAPGFGGRAISGISIAWDGEVLTPPGADQACLPDLAFLIPKCPDLDFDGDGIKNGQDKCPKDPGPVENHGCPWPDRDGDGTPDRFDNCPDEPGPPENQGCPWEQKQRVVLRKERIEILDKVFFEFDKATILPESYSLLDQVARVLRLHPELVLVRVDGHTDNVGTREYNLKLSKARAEAVRSYLIEKGVEPERLESAGFGFDKPIASNETDEGRSKNRRVEFLILGVDTSKMQPAP